MRTDEQRARFMIALKDAEVILAMREMKFMEAIIPLCRRIAGGESVEFTQQQRASIALLMEKHERAVQF